MSTDHTESSDDWHFIAAGDWGSNNETIKTVTKLMDI